jgi:hypothetical protein
MSQDVSGSAIDGHGRSCTPELSLFLSDIVSTDSTFMGLAVRKCQVGPEVGPTSASYSCVPTGVHGPACVFWANLKPFSLLGLAR